jgi:hypothetical protein
VGLFIKKKPEVESLDLLSLSRDHLARKGLLKIISIDRAYWRSDARILIFLKIIREFLMSL